MTHYFSAPGTGQAGGFYTRETHGKAIPKGAVKVTRKRHAELLAAQDRGASIVAGKDGKPVAQFPAAADRKTFLAAALRREARRRIDMVSPQWRQMNDLRQPSKAGQARFDAIDAIRQASDRIQKRLAKMDAAKLAEFDVRTCDEWNDA